MRRFIFWIILIVLIYAFVEGLSYSCFFFYEKELNIKYEPVDTLSNKEKKALRFFLSTKNRYHKFSSKLGWTIKENGTGKRGLYRANSCGIRSNNEYELNPPAHVLRISTFGDSFTHCNDVGNSETWQAFLESFSADLEVMNFGVAGYGLDQAYLRYAEEGFQYKSAIVFIGYYTDDIFRHVTTYWPFYSSRTGVILTKPRFIIENDELLLIPNPIRKPEEYTIMLRQPREILHKIGNNDFYYSQQYASSSFDFSPTVRLSKIVANRVGNCFRERIIVDGYYNETSEAFRVTKKIFDKFCASVVNNNSIPVILIFPGKEDINRYRVEKTKKYLPLLLYLNSKGYQCIDFTNVLTGTGPDYATNKLFEGKGHYSPFANRLIATHLQEYLKNHSMDYSAQQ
jgi:hypothetical protein